MASPPGPSAPSEAAHNPYGIFMRSGPTTIPELLSSSRSGCFLGMQTMAQILKLDDRAPKAWTRVRSPRPEGRSAFHVPDNSRNGEAPRELPGMHEFWPEVGCRLASDEPATVDPANRPGRVLAELALLLTAAGAAVMAVSLFVTPPPGL